MARNVKEHTVRRNEILDVAQRLVYTKGYEQMTIQDILDELQIAKGTFYHYFGSKQELLEAILERMIGEVERLLLPIMQDPQLPALEKLQRLIDTSARWKTAKKTFFLALLRVWYTDDNAIVRQKALANGYKLLIPLLTSIIHQGIQEGILTTLFPDHVGEVVLLLLQGAGDAIARLLISCEQNHDTLRRMESIVAVHTDALERVLGAPPGSLCLVDAQTLKEWVEPVYSLPG